MDCDKIEKSIKKDAGQKVKGLKESPSRNEEW